MALIQKVEPPRLHNATSKNSQYPAVYNLEPAKKKKKKMH